MGEHVVIVGGGFSGTVVAARILAAADRHRRVTVVEPGAELGLGVGAPPDGPDGTVDGAPDELSALPDRPDDFVLWLADANRTADGRRGVTRSLYGRYVHDVLERALGAAPTGSRFRWVMSRADGLLHHAIDDTQLVVPLADGRRLLADRVVLALGAPPPGTTDPLAVPVVRAAAASGILRLDPSGHRLDVTADGHPVDVAGRTVDRVTVTGWLRSGPVSPRSWVRDLREEAADVAHALGGDHLPAVHLEATSLGDDDGPPRTRHRSVATV